ERRLVDEELLALDEGPLELGLVALPVVAGLARDAHVRALRVHQDRLHDRGVLLDQLAQPLRARVRAQLLAERQAVVGDPLPIAAQDLLRSLRRGVLLRERLAQRRVAGQRARARHARERHLAQAERRVRLQRVRQQREQRGAAQQPLHAALSCSTASAAVCAISSPDSSRSTSSINISRSPTRPMPCRYSVRARVPKAGTGCRSVAGRSITSLTASASRPITVDSPSWRTSATTMPVERVG